MTREEFNATYQRAQSNYQQALQLMNADSPFMLALPKKIAAISEKMKHLIAGIPTCKTGPEAVHRVRLLKDLVVGFAALDTDLRTFFDETPELWKRNKELMDTYHQHSHPGSNMPHTQQGATEWVTQLDESATNLLSSYRELNSRIVPIRQRYNQLMQQAQPYLN